MRQRIALAWSPPPVLALMSKTMPIVPFHLLKILSLFATLLGRIHTPTVKLPAPTSRDGESGTVSCWLLPLNWRAFPKAPATAVGALTSVAVFELPELSGVVVPPLMVSMVQ